MTAKPERPADTTLTIQVEGNDESIAVHLNRSTLGYSLYYETSRYRVVPSTSVFASHMAADQYRPTLDLGTLPPVYLEVGRLAGLTPDAALPMIAAQLASTYSSVTHVANTRVGVDQIDALVLAANNGTQWDSAYVRVAVFSDGAGGAFYALMAYFLEAEEGHGSRFTQMLDTLRVE